MTHLRQDAHGKPHPVRGEGMEEVGQSCLRPRKPWTLLAHPPARRGEAFLVSDTRSGHGHDLG